MTEINSNLTIEEATELAEVMTAEHEAYIIKDETEAYIINDEVNARVINDEIDAYKIKDNLEQVAETFDALEAAGVDVPAMSPEDYDKQRQARDLQDMMARHMAAWANHQPGKEHKASDGTVYMVQAYPHKGVWMKDKKENIVNPNRKNKSVRRKLKNINKYNIVNL